MSREFNVGDVVHIKSEGHMELQYGMHNRRNGKYVGLPIRNSDGEFCTWVPEMFIYCGSEAVISRKCDWKDTYTYEVKIDGEPTGWSWSPQCFEEYDKEVEND